MKSHDGSNADRPVTRRRLLSTLGTGGVAAMGATAGCVDSVTNGGDATTTTAEGTVQFGHSSSFSGTYLDVGTEERLGFELAVQHLNGGGGLVDEDVFDGLTGDGVLGRQVETVTLDTAGSAEQARSNLSPYLAEDDLAMFCGGVAGAVASEHRAIADEQQVPYMAGTALLSPLTGENCSPHVYREQAPSDAVIRALLESIGSELGDQPAFEQLYVDAPEGRDFVDSVRTYFARDGTPNWEDVDAVSVRKGTTQMDAQISRINEVGVDVLFCHLFGLDAVNFLTQAAEDLSDDVTVIMPWINQSIAENLKGAVDGVVGTVSWDSALDTVPTKSFAESYLSEAATVNGSPSHVPTGPAHHMYCQTLSFAAAAERAGSFDAVAVRNELEGLTYDIGLGEETLQACNHQANKAIPIVQGQSEQTSNGGWFEVVGTAMDAVASCDERPASNCSL